MELASKARGRFLLPEDYRRRVSGWECLIFLIRDMGAGMRSSCQTFWTVDGNLSLNHTSLLLPTENCDVQKKRGLRFKSQLRRTKCGNLNLDPLKITASLSCIGGANCAWVHFRDSDRIPQPNKANLCLLPRLVTKCKLGHTFSLQVWKVGFPLTKI